MIALLFEAYGAVCLAALVAFLVWASAAKLRPDLDGEELDLAEREKLKKMVSSGRSAETHSTEPPIIEEPSRSPPTAPARQSKRALPRAPNLFHTRKPRTI